MLNQIAMKKLISVLSLVLVSILLVGVTMNTVAMNKEGPGSKAVQFTGDTPTLVLTSNINDAATTTVQGKIEPAAGKESPPTLAVAIMSEPAQTPAARVVQWRNFSTSNINVYAGLTSLSTRTGGRLILKYLLTGIAPMTNPTCAEMQGSAQWRQSSSFTFTSGTMTSRQPGSAFAILKKPMQDIAAINATINPTTTLNLTAPADEKKVQWRSNYSFSVNMATFDGTVNQLAGRTLNAVSSGCVALMNNAQMLSTLEQMQPSSDLTVNKILAST